PGARHDTEGIGGLDHVCARAVEIVNDVEARVLIRGVESRAKLLFSQDGHVGVAAGSLEGVAALKFQIYNALSNLRGRLQALQDREPPTRAELPAAQPGAGRRVGAAGGRPRSGLRPGGRRGLWGL